MTWYVKSAVLGVTNNGVEHTLLNSFLLLNISKQCPLRACKSLFIGIFTNDRVLAMLLISESVYPVCDSAKEGSKQNVLIVC